MSEILAAISPLTWTCIGIAAGLALVDVLSRWHWKREIRLQKEHEEKVAARMSKFYERFR